MRTTSTFSQTCDDPSKSLLPAEGFVRISSLAGPGGATGLAKSTFWLRVRKGNFPAPIKLSVQVTVWRVEDVRSWLADPIGWQTSNAGKE